MLKKYLSILAVFALFMMIAPLIALFRDSSGDKQKTENKGERVTVRDHKTGESFELYLKDYIKGVVAANIPAVYEPETLKAQAAASYTYAVRHINSDTALSTDPAEHQAYIPDNELKSIYGENYSEYKKRISEATDAVFGEILLYQNEPIAAAYFAFSNGKTESAANVWGQDIPYLIPADSPHDINAPNYQITVSISAEEVLARLTESDSELVMPVYKTDWFKIAERSDSGYVTKVAVGNKTMTGIQIRTMFDLKSTDFEIVSEDDQFLFTTKGSGHAVGLSQHGANEMAKEGKTYTEILKHYYTGIEISSQ
ncbi:MAG: stage II sporulation protein D [Oscillospiraceae bacterium]|nr:stage II sporulation protein D [Oscillospiraceae bacterium]